MEKFTKNKEENSNKRVRRAEENGSKNYRSSIVGNQSMLSYMQGPGTIQKKAVIDRFPDKGISTVLSPEIVKVILWSRANGPAFNSDMIGALISKYGYDRDGFPEVETDGYTIEFLTEFLYQCAQEEGTGKDALPGLQHLYLLLNENLYVQYNARQVFIAALYDGYEERNAMASSDFSEDSALALIDKTNKYQFGNFGQLSRYLHIKTSNAPASQPSGHYQVDIINVGQGSSALVANSKSTKYGLIDTGPNLDNTRDFLNAKYNQASQPVADRRDLEAKREGIPLNAVTTIITHPHKDHNSGGKVIPGLPWSMVGEKEGSSSYNSNTADNDDILEQAGGLSALPINKDNTTGDANDDSLVTYLETPQVVFIFPGDRRVEELLEASYKEGMFKGKGVVLMASHHGSVTGTNGELIRFFYSKEASSVDIIISAGIENQHRHPSAPELIRPGAKRGISPEQGSTLSLGSGKQYQVYSTQNLDSSKGSVSVKASDDAYSVYSKQKSGKISAKSASGGHYPAPFDSALLRRHNLDSALTYCGDEWTVVEILEACFYYSKKAGKLPVLCPKNQKELENRLKAVDLDLKKLKAIMLEFYSGYVGKCQKYYELRCAQEQNWNELVNEMATAKMREIQDEASIFGSVNSAGFRRSSADVKAEAWIL